MSVKAAGRNAILPFRPRQLPEIDTVWVDVSTILCIPPGFMSGIPRTIRKLLASMKAEGWPNIRLCVVVPDVGLAEVHPNCIEVHDAPLNPLPVPAAPPPPVKTRQHSRFWYIPWAVRHQFRTTESSVRSLASRKRGSGGVTTRPS